MTNEEGIPKSDGLKKIFLAAFAVALVLYLVSFSWIQYQREYKGPWQITFSTDHTGTPFLLISQPALKISQQKIIFEDHQLTRTNLAQKVLFGQPTSISPFGEIVFQDPTFLPGTIAFNFWNHEVELMPRALVIDKKEILWNSAPTITVNGPGKFERKPVKKPFIL